MGFFTFSLSSFFFFYFLVILPRFIGVIPPSRSCSKGRHGRNLHNIPSTRPLSASVDGEKNKALGGLRSTDFIHVYKKWRNEGFTAETIAEGEVRKR